MIVPFDTHEIAKRLEAGGFSPQQADAFVGALTTAASASSAASAESASSFATKDDVERGFTSLRTDIAALAHEMRAGFARVDQQFAVVDQRFATMDQRIVLSESRAVIKLGAMMAVVAGLVLAALRYLPATHL